MARLKTFVATYSVTLYVSDDELQTNGIIGFHEVLLSSFLQFWFRSYHKNNDFKIESKIGFQSNSTGRIFNNWNSTFPVFNDEVM